MKTTRSRILIIVIAASVVVSILMNWSDVERGFWEGWHSDNRVSSPSWGSVA